MFVSFSKTLVKFGGFRIGLRMTKKNSAWLLFLALFVWMFQLCWYMMVLCGWIIYAMIYAMVYGIKKLASYIKANKKEG